VQAPRGARAIALASARATRVRNAEHELGFSDIALPNVIVSVRLVTTPEVAVELETEAVEVFVQDKFGTCRMLKPRSKGYLKRGEILYLAWSKARGTRYGYVLDLGEDVKGNDANANAGKSCEANDVIELASEDDGERDDEERGRAAKEATKREKSSARDERDDLEQFVNGSATRAKEGAKGGAGSRSDERVIELDAESNSDEEPQRTRARGESGASAGGSAREAPSTSAHGSARAEWRQRANPYEFQQPPRANRAPPSMWGGSTNEELRRQAERARVPEPPPEGLADDPWELRKARAALKQKHHELVEALNTEVAMRQALQQSQTDFQRTMRAHDYTLRQWHRQNLDEVAGKYQQSQFQASACRSAYQQALAYFHVTVHTCEAMKDTRAPPHAEEVVSDDDDENEGVRASAKRSRATSWEAECEAWAKLLETDPSDMSLKDLRRCATDIGIDVTAMVEREDFVSALKTRRTDEAEAFKAKKLKREEEETARKRKRDADRAARRATNEEETAKHEAVRRVAALAKDADLRLFLIRCGIPVPATGGQVVKSTKRLLKGSYKEAMMTYHPDRVRQKSVHEQAFASEVTKWITQAWQNLPE